MSNRFHSKYHRKNHHTYGNATNPEASHDPIASPDQPFLGDFSLQGALCAVAPASAYAGYFYSNNTALCAMAGNRGLYVRGLNPTTSVGIESFSLNIPLSTAYGRNLLHGQVGINKNIITTGYVLDVLGDTNLDGNLNVVKDVEIDGGDLIASTPNFNLLNTTTTTINFGGAATNIEIGSTASTSTVNINGTEESTSCASGALVVDGGVGIAKNLNVCGTVALNGTTESTSCTTGTLVVAGGVGIAKNLNVCGNATIAGDLTVDGTWTYLNTQVQVTSAIEVYNIGTGPALKVTQTGTNPIAHFIDSNGDDIVFNDNGFVGIGINTPTEKLTVIGRVSATGFRADQGKPSNVDSSTNGYAFGSDGDTGLFSPINTGGAANGLLSLYSNNVERLRIDNTLVSINSDLSAQDDIYVTDNLYFGGGLTPDTNLYRKSANLLKTDDSFEATKIYSTNTAGNSDQWNSTYTSVSQASADWDYAATNIDGKMPLYTNIPVSQVGDLSYLGLDIKGDFKGPQSSNYEKPYILQEKDGSMVGIRPGYNGVYRKQFYIRASTTDLTDLIVTDIEYRPSFLLAAEYVSNLIDGNEYGICVTIRNTTSSTVKYYWINVNDTMDYSQHTYVDVTQIFSTFAMAFGSGSLVYCKEKNWYIASKLMGNAVYFNVYDSNFTQLGSTYTQVDLDSGVGVNYGTYSGNNLTLLSINHTNRPTIEYSWDSGNNRLILTHNVSILMYYPTAILGVYYRSACYFNASNNAYTDIFPKTENSNTRYGIYPDTLATITYPFYFTINSSGHITNYAQEIKHRKFYKIDDNTILESIKNHAWEPTQFSFVKHTLNGSFTWQDFIIRPYDFVTPNTSRTPEKIFYVNDASLLGKDIRYSYWVSPNDIVLWAQSKSSSESAPSRKWVKVHIDDYTDRTEKIYNIGDTLETPSSVVPSTTTLLNGMDHIHTTLNSSGTMRVKALDGLVFKELNGATGTITNSNVSTLPSDYVTQILQILNTDTNKIGSLATRSIDYDWELYHLKNGTFLLVYGYYASGTGVKSYFKIVTLSGTTLSAVSNTGTLVGTYTTAGSNVIANAVIVDITTCGIYDDGTYLYCIFKCAGPYGPGSNRLTTSVAKIQQSNNTIISYKSDIYSLPSWHTVTASVHPYFGPCVMGGHIDELTKNDIHFVNKTSITDLNTRITSCFSDIFNNTPITNSGLYSLTLKSALGFNLYISDTPIFMKGSYYILPTQSIDLDSLFPSGAVKNKTFYAYVELSTDPTTGDTIPVITFLTSFRQDGTALIYIGTVITDNNGIIYTNFEKITKINTPLKVGNNIHMDISGKVGINSEIDENYSLIVGGPFKCDPNAPIEKSATYEVKQDDHDKTILANSGSTININLPSGLKAGTQVSVIRVGAGIVQFAKGTGSPGLSSTPTNDFKKLGFQNSVASAYWTGSTWYLVGDLLS